mmetsp:Transcript_119033/g.337446  ORF Transcript_119033/g.337446 Transcript_119033/m.337446 type:complete len:140 (-) Transcript_119033:63-482(-)|eukprot:CAMPEP_0179259586 /NCGR_PEP_ID=MMETSP0797-20121207/25901_1 /TAXON_ID=47934 /ORGANISM="Dinophysis acuminata, Strain DAEP01" /LENGTH=139 /DNA_ID=CAMNT_0020967641 /DNA_START=79 /DNA_END=498 /DNA_ORIENTATION=+
MPPKATSKAKQEILLRQQSNAKEKANRVPCATDETRAHCAAIKDDALQMMWSKGWVGAELEILSPLSFIQLDTNHTDVCPCEAGQRNLFVKARVGTESYGEENIDEFALLHILVDAADTPELRGIKLRYPAEADPECFV